MPPAISSMNEGDEKKSKVSKGAAIGAAVGVGVAAAGGGAVAGATVLKDTFGKKHYDLDEDEDEVLNNEGDENDGYYDDDKDLDKEKNENEKEDEDKDENNDEAPPEKRDPRDDDDRVRRDPRERRNRDEGDDKGNDNGGRNTRGGRDDDEDGGDIDERTDTIIEKDEIEVDTKDGEWTPVGWRTITDQDGNEVNGMLFEDGNGGYVLITEGEPGSGIYDVAMNPYTGETMAIDEQFAFTRGDLEAIDNPDGGYIAPGSEDEIFVDNNDINDDIIVTDNGDLTAQRELPNGGEDTFNPDGTIYEDDVIDGPVDEEIIEDDEIALVDEENTVIEDDEFAMVDEEVVVNDEEIEQYLGEDEVAEVNEEPVEFVDDSQELVADNNTYIPEDSYDDSMEMEADIYDDGDVDMV